MLVYTGRHHESVLLILVQAITPEIDSLVGVKYEVYFEKGSSVSSHMAIFYKFSKPNHSVYYNYLTHKSKVLTTVGKIQALEVRKLMF